MSIQEALATAGITQAEYNMISRIREPLKKGLSCEVKATKDGELLIYEVSKQKVEKRQYESINRNTNTFILYIRNMLERIPSNKLFYVVAIVIAHV